MNLTVAVARACQEPSLLDALSWIAVWESERAIQQALTAERTGVNTGGDGAKWDTFFRICFKDVMEQWTRTRNPPEAGLMAL